MLRLIVGLVAMVAIAAPACDGRSIRIGEDEPPLVPADDEGYYGGSSGGGGVGGFGGTSASSGGTFPVGGSFPAGGAIAAGGMGIGGTAVGGGTNGGTTIGGSANGGTAIGGSANGGTAIGGTSGVGGVTPTGGAPACGSAGAPNVDPECRGIKSNMACPIDGKMCPWLPCGLADSGRRECVCLTTWTCTSCDYSNSQFRDPPAVIPACPSEIADEVPCTTVNQVCGPVNSEYCACYVDCVDGLIWDCNSPPSTWF